ncbi:MAG: cyclic nucleotide-binding domain-containing protein [Myxococcota bacterium]
MASTDKLVRKHKERATAFSAKGRHAEALEEYTQAVRLDGRDLGLRQKLADTHARLGHRAEAIHEYQAVAGSYAADGLLLKAIAICKVILALDETHRETQEVLADLYAQKRGAIDVKAVLLPKAMSGAMGGRPGRRSASEIRGMPAGQLDFSNPHSPVAATAETTVREAPPVHAHAPVTTAEEELDFEIDHEIDVISVESATVHAPPSEPLQTDLHMFAPEHAGRAASLAGSTAAAVGQPLSSSHDDEEGLGGLLAEEFGDGEEDFLGEAWRAAHEAAEEEAVEIVEMAEVEVEDLSPIPLLSDLPRDAFIALTERMQLHHAQEGEVLISEGDHAASMFIVVQGTVKVMRNIAPGHEVTLAELSDGAFFGEMALLSDAPRTASVVALQDSMLFEVSRDLMNEISLQYPGVREVLRDFYTNRLIANLLRTSPLFEPFSPSDKRELIEKFTSREVDAARVVIERGKPSDGLYVLLNGRCDVVGEREGQEVVLAELKDGDVFGEMSLLSRGPAGASVRTSSRCTILRLAKNAFDVLIMTHPQVLETLARFQEARSVHNEAVLRGAVPASRAFLV